MDPTSPYALCSYAYRGGDYARNKGLALGSAGWSTNWTTFDAKPPSPDSEFVQNITIVTDWWFSRTYAGPPQYQNRPHGGTAINNLWTDGSANTCTLGANLPYALNTWYDWQVTTQAGYNPLSFYAQQPFFWALNDYYGKSGGG